MLQFYYPLLLSNSISKEIENKKKRIKLWQKVKVHVL